MKKLITICAVLAMILAFSGTTQATLWEIQDTGLQDTTNFVNTGSGTDGVLNSRSDITGNPGTQFNITLTNGAGGWTDITIGDGFNLPSSKAGLVAATGNSGDLSGYTGYTMTIQNPGTEAFIVALYMNTGWTDSPWNETNCYYQSGDGSVTWVGAGETVSLTLDFSNAALYDSGWTTGNTVQNLGHITDIGFKIGANIGNQGEIISSVAFDVNVIPEPATICLLGLGALGLIYKK